MSWSLQGFSGIEITDGWGDSCIWDETNSPVMTGRVAAEHDQAPDFVFEFAHVARPGVFGQQRLGLGREGFGRGLGGLGVLAQEVPRQRWDVFAALAQRRHLDLDDVEPVVEVLAEQALADEADEVFVGGGDNAHADCAGFLAADAADLAVFEDTQQFALHVQAEVADLVKEQRALVGEFEQALVVGETRR